MTATVTPLRPKPSREDGRNPAPNAHGRAHAHEEAAPPAAGGARARAAAEWAGSLASGASLLAAVLPSMIARWRLHAAAAEFYSNVPMRWGRYAWGIWDTYVESPVVYGWSWSGQHPWWRALVVTVLAGSLWLLGVRVHVHGWLPPHKIVIRL